MQEIFHYKLSRNIEKLSNFRKEILNELLETLYKDQYVSGVLLGGSLSYKEDIEKSDVDLFCLIEKPDIFEKNFRKNSQKLKNFDAIIYQGTFPWTEKLYTIYYQNDLDFSIDVCIIGPEKQETFFWEPEGFIIFDKTGLIETYRGFQLNSRGFTRQPFLKLNPFSLAIITLKKIEKNLSRGHLWNALEQLSILRRYLMQIIRINVIKNTYFLGRVDRDIEEILPADLNKKLSLSTARYDKEDIASKAIYLSEIAETLTVHLSKSQEMDLKKWILKQIEHEQIKLSKHI